MAHDADLMVLLLRAVLVDTQCINSVVPARLGRERLLKDVFAVLPHYEWLAVDRDLGCGSRVTSCV